MRGKWSGAEDAWAGVGSIWRQPTNITVAAGGARNGSYYFINDQGGAGGSYAYVDLPSSVSELYIRIAHTAASPTLSRIIGWGALGYISYADGGLISLVIGSTVVAYGTIPVSYTAWTLFEVRVKIADSGGIVQVKVNGILDIDYTGDTKPDANTTFNYLYNWAAGDAYGTYETHIDDFAYNDTTGAVDNSWVGDGRILFIPTDAAGDVTQLTPSAGNNYACVDERPPNGDTDYVESGTVDQYDLYNLAASGLAAGSTITRVKVIANAKDTVANGGKIKTGLKTVSTEYFGDDLTLTTDYGVAEGTEYTTNPNTGIAWTIAQLDALQVGVKVRGT